MSARLPRVIAALARHLWLTVRPRGGEERRFRLDRSGLALRHELGLGLGPGGQHARLLGHDVEYLDLADLRRLFDEVFGRRVYAFAPRTEAPLILDLGANIGMSVLFFKRLVPGCRIVAFEPDPASFAVLERNVRRNRLDGVTLINAAVAAQAGEVDLYADRRGHHSLLASLIPGRAPTGTPQRVPAVTLSEHVGEDVDLLKVDIEGAEEGVLGELGASGRLGRVREMHVEYHHHVVAGDDRLSHLLALLEGHGFGYQIAAQGPPPEARAVFQDLMIHAYRKDEA